MATQRSLSHAGRPRGGPAPVTFGSPRSRTRDTGAFRVTEAWFPPGAVLHPHTHDRDIYAVMLEGSFETRISSRHLACTPAVCWTEPREEVHANYVGQRGARVLVAQPDPTRDDFRRAFGRLLDNVSAAPDPRSACDARRIAVELARPDAMSNIVVDSLMLLMLVRSARCGHQRDTAGRAPLWLERAREMVHAGYRGALNLTQLAAAVDVSAWHLAREFRRYYHASIGEYARSLRLAWALEQLASTDTSISEIAGAAGYADQSHFTRACRAATGCAPAAYRARIGG